MRALLALLAFVTGSSAAMAAGGMSCETVEDGVVLSLEGGVTRGMGGALFSFAGKAELSGEAIAEDFRAIVFEREHVAQYWLDGETLGLVLYREREGDAPHGYVQLTVRADAVEPHAEYSGSYSVSVYDMTDATDSEAKTEAFEGRITCSVE